MKILLAPDSFKGALSASRAAQAMADGLRRVWPDAEIVQLPIADGGEGTLDALVTATKGQTFTQTVTGPLGTSVSARWGLLGDGATAVVELAEAAGLTLVPADQRDPKTTTTYGVGELLHTALAYPGVRRVIVGLGGSATNDGGSGLLSALGMRFLDAQGDSLSPGGAPLANLATVDTSTLFLDPASLELLIACDVDNPLTGPRGASAIFGPQKGATPEDIMVLDAALERMAGVLEGLVEIVRLAPFPLPLPPASGAGVSNSDTPEASVMVISSPSGTPAPDAGGRGRGKGANLTISTKPGSGAAGGTAFGLLWLFPKATLQPGIDLILDAIGFEDHLRGADLVLTGEGRLDGQTLGGKAVAGVARRAHAADVPVGALVGGIGADVDAARLAQEAGIHAVLPLAPGPCTLDESIANTAAWLTDAAERAARWMTLR
jgi:glycerate kinase